MKRLFLFTLLSPLWTQPLYSQTISLEQAMAHPDWIGREPRQPYWADDSESVFFFQKREGSEQTDLFQVALDGEDLRQIPAEEFGSVDVQGNALSADRRMKTYAREGDIYVKDLERGDITQLTRSAATESDPVFNTTGDKVIFTRDDTIFVRDLDTGLEYQAAEIRLENPPGDEDRDFLEEQQSRLFDIIRLEEQREDLEQEYDRENRRLDATRLGLPYYPGEDMEIVTGALSPNENWLLLSLRDQTEREPGREGSMPNYVTASGYVENREVRSRVGTTDFANQQLYLFDLRQHRYAEIDLSDLPARDQNPLQQQLNGDGEASPRTEQAGAEAADGEEPGPREIRFAGMRWSDDGSKLLFNALSRDNKDRWLVRVDTTDLEFAPAAPDDDEAEPRDESLMAAVDLASDHIQVIHHLHDPAWINSGFNTAYWLADNESILFLSEADGYGHLYLHREGVTRQITQGRYEIREPLLTRDGETVYFRGNIEHPTRYEIYRADLDDGTIQRLTELGGMNRFRLSPDESKLLLLHSEALHPMELYVQNARPGARPTRITHTVSDEFLAVDWAQPEFVEVPSSYVDHPIHSRVYTPADVSDAPRPAVMFIHGAGYLQNAHQGWSGYFREFMFHSFLVQQGFVVMDMDYRASLGYGRDWRTAIYRQMGTPELQDLADGVDWLVANKQVDRERVCTYGGSYGGFLALMALFTEPDLFACGAALRPVTDWAHYNHGYTSNILNIPELDPAAYERSSPIEFAEGLRKPLLIAHGMQDDNVFFQDSVRLVQRLIELEKENWEMAIYPIEAHGFREPGSWLDEYRRIYKLVDATLKP